MEVTRFLCFPPGGLLLSATDEAVTGLHFMDEAPKGAGGASALLDEAQAQLLSYFAGERTQFTLPLAPVGTPFRQKVWAALMQIPYGQTITYGELAQAIGNPKACRAVGGANHHNPISIFIPCHRVIGQNGSLTGYGGGLHWKEYLLALEAAHRP